MPDPTIRLKFKGDIPAYLEFQLVHRFGFTYYSRKKGEWVVYTKNMDQPEGSHGLSEVAIKDLQTRVNQICNVFQDPDANKDIIKVRALEMCKRLNVKQAAWVEGWIRHTIDEDDDGPPWQGSFTI